MTTVTVESPALLEQQPEPVMPASRKHVDATIDFIGGVAGGTASVYIGQPLDTVKVKMQTFPTLYRNSAHCFMQTFRKEGLARGLYAGTIPSLAAQVSENAILFMFYGLCQKAVAFVSGHHNVSDLGIVHNAAAGGCASFFSSLALCPTELIKCKMQAMEQMKKTGQLEGSIAKSASKHIGPVALTRQIIREEGIRGVFRGFIPTLCREMPGYFFFFGGYEGSRALMTPDGKTKDDLKAWQTILSGAIGGASFWLAVFPTDVIKSRIQVQVGSLQKHSQTVFSVFRDILRNEGVRALYVGLGPTLLRTAPATGGLFLAYQTVKKVLVDIAYSESNS